MPTRRRGRQQAAVALHSAATTSVTATQCNPQSTSGVGDASVVGKLYWRVRAMSTQSNGVDNAQCIESLVSAHSVSTLLSPILQRCERPTNSTELAHTTGEPVYIHEQRWAYSDVELAAVVLRAECNRLQRLQQQTQKDVDVWVLHNLTCLEKSITCCTQTLMIHDALGNADRKSVNTQQSGSCSKPIKSLDRSDQNLIDAATKLLCCAVDIVSLQQSRCITQEGNVTDTSKNQCSSTVQNLLQWCVEMQFSSSPIAVEQFQAVLNMRQERVAMSVLLYTVSKSVIDLREKGSNVNVTGLSTSGSAIADDNLLTPYLANDTRTLLLKSCVTKIEHHHGDLTHARCNLAVKLCATLIECDRPGTAMSVWSIVLRLAGISVSTNLIDAFFIWHLTHLCC